MKKLLLLLCFVLGSGAAVAEPASEASVDKLLAVMHAQESSQAVMVNLDQVMKQSISASTQGQPLSPQQRQAIDESVSKIVEVMRDELSWPHMRPLYLQIYRDNFSEDKVAGLIAFYQSPVGAAYVEKMPAVIRQTMAMTQSRMAPMLEKFRVALAQAVENAQSAR